MKVQSFLSSSVASLAFVGQQAALLGSRAIVLVIANPGTVAITCVALAALGTAAYVFVRLRASEQRFKELTDKINHLPRQIPDAKNEGTGVKLDHLESVAKVRQMENTIQEMNKKLLDLQPLVQQYKVLEQTQSRTLNLVGGIQTHTEQFEESSKSSLASETLKLTGEIQALSTKLGQQREQTTKELSDKADAQSLSNFQAKQEETNKLLSSRLKKLTEMLEKTKQEIAAQNQLLSSKLDITTQKQTQIEGSLNELKAEIGILKETVNKHTLDIENARVNRRVLEKNMIQVESQYKKIAGSVNNLSTTSGKVVDYLKSKSASFAELVAITDEEIKGSIVKKRENQSPSPQSSTRKRASSSPEKKLMPIVEKQNEDSVKKPMAHYVPSDNPLINKLRNNLLSPSVDTKAPDTSMQTSNSPFQAGDSIKKRLFSGDKKNLNKTQNLLTTYSFIPPVSGLFADKTNGQQ